MSLQNPASAAVNCPPSLVAPGESENKGPWSCSTCTFINSDPLHLRCDMCGELRDVGEEESGNHQPQKSNSKSHIERQGFGVQVPSRNNNMRRSAPAPPQVDGGEVTKFAHRSGRRRAVPQRKRLADDTTPSSSLPPTRIDTTSRSRPCADTATRPPSVPARRPTDPRTNPSPPLAPRTPPTHATTAALVVATQPTHSTPNDRQQSHDNEQGEENFFRPGAYSVIERDEDDIIERQDTGFLSPSPPSDSQKPDDKKKEHMATLDQQTVVAEVVSDEALEQEIRQRILLEQQVEQTAQQELHQSAMVQNAVRAEVVRTTTTHIYPATESTTKSTAAGGGIKEKVFGSKPRKRIDIASTPEAIKQRQVLPWKFYQNKTTKMWIASIGTTNQEGAVQNINYSFESEYQAGRVGLQLAAPRMMPFDENPTCFICHAMFAVLKRPCHCRNCGICICSSCATTWSSKMVPETYNSKNSSSLNICLACDWLSTSFHAALLQGDYSKVMDLYKTGNLNLSAPFCNVKGELLYPVHCAVMGGNLDLLKWLVDDHCCPIVSDGSLFLTTSKSKSGPLVSSKGRSVLGIAQSNHRLDFVRYLVVSKGMSLAQERDLDISVTLENYTSVLELLPESVANESAST